MKVEDLLNKFNATNKGDAWEVDASSEEEAIRRVTLLNEAAQNPGKADPGARAAKDAVAEDSETTPEDSEDEPAEDEDPFQAALNEAQEELGQDTTLQEDVQAINEAYNLDEGILLQYSDVTTATDQWAAKAEALVQEIEESFATLTASCAPTWVNQQRTGVIDPIRYRTRQPGDMEYRRNFAEAGEPGHDMHVTLMLDISGSMDSYASELGCAAYAVKRAGDALGIDTEVQLFDDSAYSLWDINDRPEAPLAINSAGGTDPGNLFQASLRERRDKKHHLVLIMTDGEWYTYDDESRARCDIRSYREDNRTTILFNFAKNNASRKVYVERNMMDNYHPDEAYAIDDLFAIPRLLEELLCSLV